MQSSRIGPFSSTNITYSIPRPVTPFFFNQMLAIHTKSRRSIRDNHTIDDGRRTSGRTVVLVTALDKTSVNDAMLNMRFYATEDYNIRVDVSR